MVESGGGATLYAILHLSQYHVTGGHTGKQAIKQASKQTNNSSPPEVKALNIFLGGGLKGTA
jgi:hypothetical protein